MRKLPVVAALVAFTPLLSACGAGLNLFDRGAPDEMVVARQAPLAVPPDFALTPPEPGAPRPQTPGASQQALEAMFGGPAPRSTVESSAISKAGTAQPGIRSTVGDPDTNTVDKGVTTQDIVAAPEGDGAEAQTIIPE
ncbi:DUF3035 domain-containing protein [Croceicoccus sp. F390]|uniref:DUF3035 domain-containing protein n=1 Tax=Croceicoccus esteveae TaxID=3075597 RepID=A0ABU2ZGS4_9SPHN|nr:DUF3035 domain-containing protein [Croceicoccus sp. F390]MDT0575799.1 DUF3035 domain-containing protein [Croceicoccus sp. F390]